MKWPGDKPFRCKGCGALLQLTKRSQHAAWAVSAVAVGATLAAATGLGSFLAILVAVPIAAGASYQLSRAQLTEGAAQKALPPARVTHKND